MDGIDLYRYIVTEIEHNYIGKDNHPYKKAQCNGSSV